MQEFICTFTNLEKFRWCKECSGGKILDNDGRSKGQCTLCNGTGRKYTDTKEIATDAVSEIKAISNAYYKLARIIYNNKMPWHIKKVKENYRLDSCIPFQKPPEKPNRKQGLLPFENKINRILFPKPKAEGSPKTGEEDLPLVTNAKLIQPKA